MHYFAGSFQGWQSRRADEAEELAVLGTAVRTTIAKPFHLQLELAMIESADEDTLRQYDGHCTVLSGGG